MPFLQLTLDIDRADPAPFEEALFDIGASAVSLSDAADDPILEPKPGELPMWPTVTVTALFPGGTDADEILTTLRGRFPALPPHRFETIEDRAWEREWLKDFKPMRFGQRLWICPGGMLPPSDLAVDCQLSAVSVLLDPGLAFGTGTHPTTALCLEWLDGADIVGKEVIDYGCGSGILAIAALKLGAAQAIGIDIDPQALMASRDNATRNEVADKLRLLNSDFTSALNADEAVRPAPVVLANILAGPLDELAPLLAKLTLPGGYAVLSGILNSQAAALEKKYSQWFDMEPSSFSGDWSRLVGRRRQTAGRGL